LSDFQPEAISKQVPALAKLLEARQMLDDLMQAMDGKAEAQALVDKILRDPELLLSFAGGRESEATSPGAPAPSGGPKSK
jgi:type VI secretion system protein ImpB